MNILLYYCISQRRMMNEEKKWDHGKSAEVKEGPADCIMIGEVVTALKKVKRRIKLQVCRGYQQK